MWFDAEGHFIAKPFQQWIAGKIAVIGKAGSKSFTAASGNEPEKSVEVGCSDEPDRVRETATRKTLNASTGGSGSSRSRKANR